VPRIGTPLGLAPLFSLFSARNLQRGCIRRLTDREDSLALENGNMMALAKGAGAMAEKRIERRLTAILAADVAGYSRLIGADEEGTLAALKAVRRELIDPGIAEHHGRIVKTTGDGLLVEFASVVDALRCAAEMQRAMAERNAAIAADGRFEFRIGIHQGDIVVEDGDIFGDGVNVAARLEGLAEPGGICVSARVQEDAAGRLDLAFEDLGEQALKNIARKVRVYRVGPRGARPQSPHPNPPPQAGEGSARSARVGAAEPPALALPDKPSIAVLPFANISGDPEQEYFVDGMVEEIITALSRIRWLFVIARNSTFTYKGRAVDVKEVGRELGVRYVLEGSVRKGGNRVRITAQLIDALTGTHLWADHFDGLIEDVFELQDQVAASVAGIIEPALQAAETARSANRPTNDLTAYDLYLRAAQILSASFETEQIGEALSLLALATERDPRFALALGRAAQARSMLDTRGGVDDPDKNRAEAIGLARRCVEAATDDPNALCWAGFALGYFGEDIDAAIALVDRSLALNPSYAEGWQRSGLLRIYAGNLDLGIEHIERSMRLNPRARMGLPLTVIGIAHFFDCKFDLASPKFLAAIQEWPSYLTPYRFLAACYAHMGRLVEARELIAKLRAMNAEAEPRIGHWRKREHQELLLSGLRIAASESS
jgi:TolB-like protein/class 3 adenylate cyclase